jgi:hypothetical protein
MRQSPNTTHSDLTARRGDSERPLQVRGPGSRATPLRVYGPRLRRRGTLAPGWPLGSTLHTQVSAP